MRPDPQFPADLVIFTEEILNGKLRFLCSVGRRNDSHIHSATPIDDQDLIDLFIII